MKVAIGCDHAGFKLKQRLLARLSELGHEVIDFGTDSLDPVDYPPFCASVARAVVKGEADKGVVLGGSGQGEAIAANKVQGARAALCNDLALASLAREHNDANILAMGGRMVDSATALEILDVFLKATFEGGRHIPRLEKIAAIEVEECS